MSLRARFMPEILASFGPVAVTADASSQSWKLFIWPPLSPLKHDAACERIPGMLKSLLVAAVLLSPQKPQPAPPHPKPPETGIIAGTVVLPEQQTAAGPVEVILLSPRYTDLWNTEVQKRLDVYWERYKPAFAQNKEYFLEISRMAQKEAIDFIVTRMRRDAANSVSEYVHEASPDGKFEFKNIPFGDYKILAVGATQNEDVIWQDSVGVRTPIPQFLELKKCLP